MAHKALVVLIIALMLCFEDYNAEAQESEFNSNLSVEYSFGGILRHSSELPSVSSNWINGLTIAFNRIPLSKKKWSQCFCFPEVGAGVAYFDFGDPQLLGYSINPFISLAPYINPNGKFHIIPRGAAGISYVSRVYDKSSNPENLFFSSHISGFLQLHLSFRYDVSKHLQISSGLSYNHISNGGLKQPNKGMNFITANVGVNYFLSSQVFPKYEVTKNIDSLDRWKFRLMAFYTLKVAQQENGFEQKNTSIFGVMATAGFFIPRFSIIEGGIELIADGYLKEQLYRQGIEKDNKRLAIIMGHTARFGRLSFSTLLGGYVYSPYKAMDPVYQRYQITYDISKNVFAGVGLKAHRHVAELMLVNIGVRF
jgi:hypothetical protein